MSQSDYRYIGKDGKPVLARDLEDDRDRWRELAAREYERGLLAAVEIAQYVVKNYEVMDHTGTKYLPPKTQVAAKGLVRIVVEDIFAKIDKRAAAEIAARFGQERENAE